MSSWLARGHRGENERMDDEPSASAEEEDDAEPGLANEVDGVVTQSLMR